MREYFCAYHDMLGAMRKLSDAEVGRLFRGLLYYSMTGEEPTNLQGREELLFDVFSQQIDRDVKAYNSKCKQLQANGSRSKQMGANATRCQQMPPDASRCAQDKDKEEDKDKDKDEEEDEEEKKPAIAGKEKTTAAAVSARAGEDRQARQAEKAEEERLFDAFWIAYPRKQGKQDALKAFHALKPDAKTVGVMLQAIQQQKNSQQWRESERFIPLPATWIRGKRWEDERIRDGGQHFDAEREYTPAGAAASGSDMPDWVLDRWQDMQERGEV